LDEEEKDRLEDVISRYNQDVQMPPYDTDSRRGDTREYEEYVEEEETSRQKTSFEKLCLRSASVLPVAADESTRERLSDPLKLLNWDITPGMVVSGATAVGAGLFVAWALLFAVNFGLGNPVPVSIMAIFALVPFVAGIYTYLKPVYDAREKVVESSQEIILSVLYMVIYMESSPNLEGAVRFAALNLDGPIAKDLRGVLWNVEVRNFDTVEQSLAHYSRIWKDYNDDYLESLQLIQTAVQESNPERRDQLLDDAIDRILEGTEERMNGYAKGLKTPVAILNAFGALLPILGMIMLPLISSFIDAIGIAHLFAIFNIALPVALYWFMRQILSSRPPTISVSASDAETLPSRGKFKFSVAGMAMQIPSWVLGFAVFLLVSAYGFWGFAAFPETLPLTPDTIQSLEGSGAAPQLFFSDGSPNQFTMLMRGVSIVAGTGLGIGISKYLGNQERKEAEQELEKIQDQFPAALFELGNEISGGTPVEIALKRAAKSSEGMEISGLFRKSSQNIEQLGMTFQESLFDDSYGAVRQYPTKTVRAVMKAMTASAEKGTSMTATAAITISRYMDRLSRTQRKLENLLEESTSTIQLLAYLLAPVISGVAVGMSQVIIGAISNLTRRFGALETGNAAASPVSTLPFSSGTAISPEFVQLVVGIYLIQLLFILGNFYMKITHGQNQTYRQLFTGKVMMAGMVFYTITLAIITLTFTSILTGITTA